jgi:hypothetical protein
LFVELNYLKGDAKKNAQGSSSMSSNEAKTASNPDAAKRALAEAAARRKAASASKQDLPTELGGRDGPEPTRFGDWEKKGIASDF